MLNHMPNSYKLLQQSENKCLGRQDAFSCLSSLIFLKGKLAGVRVYKPL